MDKRWNTMNARRAMSRVGLGASGDGVIDGFCVRGGRRARDVARVAPKAASGRIERLVLAGAEEGRLALEMRADLIARGMNPRPRCVTPAREDDLVALAKASDLVLVQRKKPLRIVVPYIGRAARRLLRKSDASLLVVGGEMARAPYRRVLVAADLHTDVAAALAAVRTIAPDASLTLLHVYGAAYDGKLQWAGVAETDVAAYRADARHEAALGMASLSERHPALRGRTLLRYGWPIPAILRTSEELDADLIVVVRKSRSWWADVLGASVSLELAERARGDVLVVPAPARAPRSDRAMQ
jgi:nucleotide-binding universal stress UspA family protein